MAQTTVAINLEAKTKGTESVKSLKQQLSEAVKETDLLVAKFGATSEQALQAAKRVADLKEEIGDVQKNVQTLGLNKFQTFAKMAQGVANGIQAAQGAMALFGAESEDAQKALVKVQGAMAFAQGINELMEMQKDFGALATKIKGPVVKAFTTLRGAMMATGIGLLVVGIGLLVANFDKVSEWISKSWFGKLANAIGSAVTAITDFIGITSQAERDLEKMTKATTKSNEELGRQIEVLTALGGKEKEVYELKKRQNENELNILRQTLKTKGKLTDEEWTKFNDLKNKQKVLTIEYGNFEKQQADKKKKEDEAAAKEAAAKAQENYKKNIENERKALQDLAEERRKQLELNAKDERALADIQYKNNLERLKVALKNDLTQQNLTASARKAIQDKYAILEVNAKTEHDKKIKELDQKAKDDLKKQEEDLAKWKAEQDEKEIAGLNEYYKKKQLVAVKNNATPEQLAQIEIARMEEEKRLLLEQRKSTTDIELQILAKKKEIYDKDVENKKKAEEQKKAAEEATIKFVADGFAMIAELADAFAGKSEEQQRKAFEIKKKASMAQAVVETIQAAQSAYASQMAIATPDAPIRAAVAAALALAAGVARVRKIEQTPFEAKGLDTGGNGGGGAVPAAPSFAPTAGGTLPDEQQFGGMGRVYVLEGDITKTQTRVRRLRNTSVV